MAKIRQKTIVDQVMQHMKTLIAEGVYTPGDKIPTELELAQELGVGRSSIREAIKIFNYLGVMESKSARGTFINERSNISTEALSWALLLGNDEIDEVIELRGAIELWSFIRLTMLRKTKPEIAGKHIKKLHTVLKTIETAIAQGQHQNLIEADYEFHLQIIIGGDNPLFTELYQVLRSFMMHEIEQTQMKYPMQRKIFEEHKTLLEAIESGNILQAELTYIDHINNIKSLLKPESDSSEQKTTIPVLSAEESNC